jgi:starch synthase
MEEKTPETSTGFLFSEAEPESLAGALRRALAAYADREGWKMRQKFAMKQNFSWQRSAQDYVQIYQRLL